MIHRHLNYLALSSAVSRHVTYALSSQLAYVLVLWAAIALYLHDSEGFIRLVFWTFGSATAARLIVEGIYLFYRKPRPSSHDGITPLFINKNPSFPSGHAAFFSAIATAGIILGMPFSATFFIVTVLMCVARVAAGVHFFVDILGGYVVGVGTALSVFALLGVY